MIIRYVAQNIFIALLIEASRNKANVKMSNGIDGMSDYRQVKEAKKTTSATYLFILSRWLDNSLFVLFLKTDSTSIPGNAMLAESKNVHKYISHMH